LLIKQKERDSDDNDPCEKNMIMALGINIIATNK